MKNIILFRFYKDFDICFERIKILKYFNPDVPVYGLYGGPKENFEKALDILGTSLINIQMSSNQDPEYKWLHADQTLKEWYENYGRTLDFEYLYDYEYDILSLTSLENLYPKIDSNTVVLSGVEKLSDVAQSWNWTSEPEHKINFEKLCDFMFSTYNLSQPIYASLGPGPYFSKKFLDDFSKSKQPLDIINPVVSEIIYPYYAQALGYNIVNSGLHPRWSDEKSSQKYFNCEDIAIQKEVIIEEASKKDGRRVFHPVKYMITLDEVISWF